MSRQVRKSLARATGLHNAFTPQQKDVDAGWVIAVPAAGDLDPTRPLTLDGLPPPSPSSPTAPTAPRPVSPSRAVRKSVARATGAHHMFSAQQKTKLPHTLQTNR